MKIGLKHNIKDNFLGVRTPGDLNKVIEEGKFPTLVMLSEAYSDKRIVEAAKAITESKRRIILIAGPSSSGKTTFAKKLCIHLMVNGLNPLYLGTDDYFVEREETPLDELKEKNFEDLGALDVKLFNDNIRGLLAGEVVDLPTFDFITGHKVFGTRLTKIDASQPIVIEGIHGLNDLLTPQFTREEKFKIYICPITSMKTSKDDIIAPEDQRLLRRITRDAALRGRDARETIKGWVKVRKGEEKNIVPFAQDADLLFNSSLIYEVAVLKKFVTPHLLEIKESDPEYEVAKKLLTFLDGYDVYEDDTIVPTDSILKEFIGGSLYRD